MRLFVASPIILNDYPSIKKGFNGIIEGKWTEEDHLHLTWVFLGEVKEAEPVIERLSGITRLESEVGVAELGYFGRPPKIFFAKAEEKILYYKAREFKATGFDMYRFKPHITLCHIKTIHNYKAYKEILNHYQDKILGSVLPQISLYQSTLNEKGPLYKCIFDIEKPIKNTDF